MPEMDGWFETENGLELFLIEEASSLEAAVLEMIDYDKDVTKQVYSMVTAIKLSDAFATRMVREDT